MGCSQSCAVSARFSPTRTLVAWAQACIASNNWLRASVGSSATATDEPMARPMKRQVNGRDENRDRGTRRDVLPVIGVSPRRGERFRRKDPAGAARLQIPGGEGRWIALADIVRP